METAGKMPRFLYAVSHRRACYPGTLCQKGIVGPCPPFYRLDLDPRYTTVIQGLFVQTFLLQLLAENQPKPFVTC